MKKYLTLILLLFLLVETAEAQKKSKVFTAQDEANMVFKNEWSIGARMHTNGFGAYFERVWIKNIYKKNLLQTNFFYYKDLKEKRTKTPYAQVFNAPGYFYGKQNNFWNVNILYGQRKILAEKADKSGVRVSMVYMGGISLGIIKPYALSIVEANNFSDSPPQTVVRFYDEDNPEEFLSPSNSNSRIFGAAGIQHGFNKIEPIPGVHAKFGFNFDWASHEYLVKSVELGVQLDVYYKKIPVLISERNKPYIINFYLAFQLGKRW